MLFQMFVAGVVFSAIAMIVGLFGFGIVSDEAPLAAKLWSVFFLLLAMAAFGWAWMNRSRQAGRPGHRESRGRSDTSGTLVADPANAQDEQEPYNRLGIYLISQVSYPRASWAY